MTRAVLPRSRMLTIRLAQGQFSDTMFGKIAKQKPYPINLIISKDNVSETCAKSYHYKLVLIEILM